MFTSVFFIIASLALFAIGTMPGYFEIDENGLEHEVTQIKNMEKVKVSLTIFFIIAIRLRT